MTELIILPENSELDCQRNGVSLYYVREGDTVRWFFFDGTSIRWSNDTEEICNFFGNCIVDKLIEKWKNL